ncbi:MAG: 3-deoxy-8-phosphooctulonate synthase [Candidatus Cloacimonetes bacterium]|nr:3-deoxy-8-phosphooctulonate synthase [Candidatus Cloacimonadota bacterium]
MLHKLILNGVDVILYKKLVTSDKFFLIAGPCVVEDERIMLQIAEELTEITQKRGINLIFKSSYKKANRTSINSETGPGLKEGMAILKTIKQKFNLPIITDIHEKIDIEEVVKVADILQIPAFLSRQTELIVAAAKTGKIVNIKKGQFMAPDDIEKAAKKVLSVNNNKIILTERGTCFGYHDLVVDFRSFAIMHSLGFPVVYDVTHSLQKPSQTNISGGAPQFAEMMAKAAIATGMVNGLFLETHPDPSIAHSDANSMLPLAEIPDLLDECLNIERN